MHACAQHDKYAPRIPFNSEIKHEVIEPRLTLTAAPRRGTLKGYDYVQVARRNAGHKCTR